MLMRAEMPADHDAGRTGELPVSVEVRRPNRMHWNTPTMGPSAPGGAAVTPLKPAGLSASRPETAGEVAGAHGDAD